jgi:FkbM family methyltransferase
MKIRTSNDTEWREQNGDYTYRINYPLTNNSIVVDLGARHGDWSGLIRRKYSPKIYCFEVVSEFCNQLKKLNYNTFCVAVSDKKEKVKLGIVQSEASLFFKESTFESESIPANEIFEIINEEYIDLIKINVEGAEYPILKNLIETNSIIKIKNIQVQFHLFNDEENSDYELIFKELSKTHKLTWRFPFVWENWELKNEI